MIKYLITCLTIFGFLSGTIAFAAETIDCSATMLDLLSSSKQDKDTILCMKGSDFFRECAGKYLKENNVTLGITMMNYNKEADMLKYLGTCK